VLALERGRRRAVLEWRAPGAAAAGEAQSVRPGGCDDVLDHMRTTLTARAERRAALYLRAVKLVDAVSLRSRRRTLRWFLDEMQPTAATTVLDVGADEVGFGTGGGHSGCGTHNFFEELYPWPGRITALGLHDGAGFRSAYPDIAYVEGDACALP